MTFDDPEVMRDEPLVRDVELVDAPMGLARGKGVERFTGGSRRRPGTPTSITKQPPGSSWAATFRKHATCAAWLVRFMIVLNTRYASLNVPSARAVAKSPIVTPIPSPPGLACSRAAIAC